MTQIHYTHSLHKFTTQIHYTHIHYTHLLHTFTTHIQDTKILHILTTHIHYTHSQHKFMVLYNITLELIYEKFYERTTTISFPPSTSLTNAHPLATQLTIHNQYYSVALTFADLSQSSIVSHKFSSPCYTIDYI